MGARVNGLQVEVEAIAKARGGSDWKITLGALRHHHLHLICIWLFFFLIGLTKIRESPPHLSLVYPISKSEGYVESKMFFFLYLERKKKGTKNSRSRFSCKARKEHLSTSLILVLFCFCFHLKPFKWIPKNNPLPIVHTKKKTKKNNKAKQPKKNNIRCVRL